MVNKNKTHRLMIQVTTKQYNWLLNKATQLDISISQLVRWLLNKKIRDINDINQLDKNPKEATQTNDNEINSQEEWNKLLEEAENLTINKQN